MKRIKYIDIFIIMFVSIILSQYFNGRIIYFYDIVSILILVYLCLIKRKKYNVRLDARKAIYIFYFSIMIAICTIIRIFDKTAIIFTLRIIIIASIVYRVLSVYGENYINNFFVNITRVMFILNTISIFEYINHTNFYYRYLSDNYLMWFQGIGQSDFRISSVFVHPIVYGNILVITLAILFFIKPRITKKYYYSSILLIVINLFGTQSRSSWIAFIILTTLILISKFNMFKQLTLKKILMTFISIFVLIIVLFIFKDLIKSLIENVVYRFSFGDESDISKIQRIGAISNILENISSNISDIFIGNGINSLSEFMIKNQVVISGFKSADNQYMTLMYEMGVLYTLIYCIYLFKCILHSFKVRNNKNLICMAILGGISINMFFYEALYWKIPMLFFLIALLFDCLYIDNSN